MKLKSTDIGKAILFICILIWLLHEINMILVPKYIDRNDNWTTTSQYNQFYDMEDASVDVVFLGSSVCACAFSPQEIYNEYGIRSYNLASMEQSIPLSYYWLKEACRKQNIKVAVLDTKFLFPLTNSTPINMHEPFIRRCIDSMRLSPVKAEAVKDICDLDPSQVLASYYLTNLRFHSRWTDIHEYDFVPAESKCCELKGQAVLDYYGWSEYEPFDPETGKGLATPHPVCNDYLIKMIDFCKQNDIKLVLTSIPDDDNEMSDEIYNYINKITEDFDIDYINMCETSVFEALDMDYPVDAVTEHANFWAAVKMSKYIGALLHDKYHIESHVDTQYENTREYYNEIRRDCELVHIDNFYDYLSAINRVPEYTIFLSVRGGMGDVSEINQKALHSLGLTSVFERIGHDGYIAIIDQDEGIFEESSNSKTVTKISSIRDGRTIYTILSGGDVLGTHECESSIIIDGEEYSDNRFGLNIVVYNKKRAKVIDNTHFEVEELAGEES